MVRIAPVARLQFFNLDGSFASGGELSTYAAGSSTPLPTFTDSTGSVQNPTTITLNARGETPNGVWLTEGLAYKFVARDSDGVVIHTEDNLRGINDASLSVDEWISPGLTPTYISNTSFRLPGDQTSEFHTGRRLKSSISAGTGYHRITGSSFGAGVTTVTVNGTTLDNGLSGMSYSILRASNPSLPTIGDLLDISGTGGGQIKFPSTQNPSTDPNTLDDYEKGTWTIGLTFGGGSTGMTFAGRTARYTKHGDVMTCFAEALLSAKGSSTGVAAITGLPFAVVNATIAVSACARYDLMNTITTPFGVVPVASGTTATLTFGTTPGSMSGVLTDAHFNNNSYFTVTFQYKV